MSSIMRWRRGLIVAIWVSCLERGGAKTNILSDRTPQFSRLASTPAQRVRSIRDHDRLEHARQAGLEDPMAAVPLAFHCALPCSVGASALDWRMPNRLLKKALAADR